MDSSNSDQMYRYLSTVSLYQPTKFLSFIPSFPQFWKPIIHLLNQPNGFMSKIKPPSIPPYSLRNQQHMLCQTPKPHLAQRYKFKNNIWQANKITSTLEENKHHYFNESQNHKQQEATRKSSESKNKIQTGNRGLRNLGNICYLNSALQCLHKTFILFQKCKESPFGDKSNFKIAFLSLSQDLSKDDRQPANPSRVRQLVANYNPLFEGNGQHDSCQVLGTILRMLHQQMNQARGINCKIDPSLHKDKNRSKQLLEQTKKQDQSRQKSVIDNIFYGWYKTVYSCKKCTKNYILFQKFHAIYLPIPRNKAKVTLSDCFDEFCEEQQLVGINKIHCDGCQRDQQTVKKMSVYETNKILIVSIKRFTENAKIQKQVEVPLTLKRQLMKKCGNSAKCSYQLYGMINHSGYLHWGHYTATCYDETNGWVFYDDQRCLPISMEFTSEVKEYAKNAYVLFYKLIE